MKKLALILGMLVFLYGVGLYGSSHKKVDKVAEAVKEIAGGKKIRKGRVHLKTPVIAENGAVIPISVAVDSPMTKGNYVKALHVIVTGNPNPKAFTATLEPEMGSVSFSTRIRMGKTAEIRAYAVMNNGQVYVGSKLVKVTIGGCG